MQTCESPGRDLLRLIVWFPLRWLLLVIPVRFGIAILHYMGDLHYTVAKEKQRLLRENLQRIDIKIDEKSSARHIRTYLRNHYLDQLFPIIFPKFNLDNIFNYVTVHGLSHLDHALQNKKGVVLIHGHFGPAHLPLVTLALMGYPMKQLGNPSDSGLSWIGRNVAFRLRMSYENLIPAEIIKVTSFLRPIFTALQHNNVIMTTGDGSGKEKTFGKHELFTFFGQPLLLPLGPAILSQKTGASLLPLFIVPGTSTRFSIYICKEIVSAVSGRDGAIDCTRQFVMQMEQNVRSIPGYWHFLDRFRPGQLIETKTR